MISKIKIKIRSLFAPKSPLKKEMYYLKFSIKKTNNEIDYIYDLPYYSCCMYCAYPKLYDLEDKLDRQMKQMKLLKNKIDRDSR